MRSASRPLCMPVGTCVSSRYVLYIPVNHAEDHPSHHEGDGKYVHVAGPPKPNCPTWVKVRAMLPRLCRNKEGNLRKNARKKEGPLSLYAVCMHGCKYAYAYANMYGKMRWVMYERMCLR